MQLSASESEVSGLGERVREGEVKLEEETRKRDDVIVTLQEKVKTSCYMYTYCIYMYIHVM